MLKLTTDGRLVIKIALISLSFIRQQNEFRNVGLSIFKLISLLLGPFGFLHTGTGSDDIRGNFGIRDQIRALWWVKNNIYRFGGSPNRVRKVDKNYMYLLIS